MLEISWGFKEFLCVYPDFLGNVCTVYKFNLTAFINSILASPLCRIQNNPSNCCRKSFEDPLFICFGLLRSPVEQASSVHFIPWQHCFIFLPLRRNEGAPYLLAQRSLTRWNWERCSLPATWKAQREVVTVQGETTQQEMPAGRDGLTLSSAWLLPGAALWAAHRLGFYLWALNGGEMCSKWCKAQAQSCSRGIILYSSGVASLLSAWTFSSQCLTPVIFRETCCFSNLGKTAGSPGFKNVCVLHAWGQRALRLFAGPGVLWDCRSYYHLSQIHLTYSHRSDP